MKVKIITELFSDNLEKDINMFLVEIHDKKVIDIKFQHNKGCGYNALIIYE